MAVPVFACHLPYTVLLRKPILGLHTNTTKITKRTGEGYRIDHLLCLKMVGKGRLEMTCLFLKVMQVLYCSTVTGSGIGCNDTIGIGWCVCVCRDDCMQPLSTPSCRSTSLLHIHSHTHSHGGALSGYIVATYYVVLLRRRHNNTIITHQHHTRLIRQQIRRNNQAAHYHITTRTSLQPRHRQTTSPITTHTHTTGWRTTAKTQATRSPEQRPRYTLTNGTNGYSYSGGGYETSAEPERYASGRECTSGTNTRTCIRS
ncbi:hypothetical protein Pcinc_020626 [Petrolisthes cinctipes]|uniref:Uncharacterized protein n=1 Tax=Petrolisthes cinctipes TaxID=88211 RepID=A0AAE1KJR4_PETCI|nr:hypothetical protein Pcinc_020626 [Petrolisthes cinctipes]